ncbi:MAG: cation transporter [Chitinophagaceae bacterium]
MKTFKIFSIIALCVAFSTTSFAQSKTDTIPVSGNCGMCKSNIEKAAKKAGAASADWNTESKILIVKYNSSSTNAAKIQQGIAAVGYDTRDFKAADEAYDKLHACCKYDRVKKEEQPSASVKKEKADCCSKEGEGKVAKEGEAKSCCSEAH